jgi:hypothetical protein
VASSAWGKRHSDRPFVDDLNELPYIVLYVFNLHDEVIIDHLCACECVRLRSYPAEDGEERHCDACNRPHSAPWYTLFVMCVVYALTQAI